MLSLHEESPSRVVQGCGALLQVAEESFAGKGLVVTTEGMVRRGQLDELLKSLRARQVNYEVLYSEANPSLKRLDAELQRLSKQSIEWVVAIGGGSSLDTGKVTAAMLASSNQDKNLPEIASGKKKFSSERLPLWCVPTTAGSGAEITPFATVWDTEAVKKRSLMEPTFVPDAVILDPELVKTTPHDLAVSCALDTCSHALESLWNRNATACSASYAHECLRGFVRAFPAVQSGSPSMLTWEVMQKASFWGGLAISQTRTAVAHAMSYPITLHLGAPHGIACSFLLPKIAALVTREMSWFEFTDRQLVDEVLALLETADLSGLMSRYGSMEQIRSLKGEMFAPGRSDNFVLGTHRLDEILK